MSIMRCPQCERSVDTDFETGEEIGGAWMCDRCAARRCEKCGEVPRLVWIGFDPPEPYGDVCGCPDEQLQLIEASADKAASDADALLTLRASETA